MTPKQYRATIDTLGLSQVAAADFLKVDDRTSRRWALGEAPIPPPVSTLLRLMVRMDLTPDRVAKLMPK